MSVTRGEIEFNRGSIEYHLPHTCTTIRRQQVGETPYEEPIYELAPYLTGIPCRFWIQSGGEQSDQRRTVLAYEYRLKLPVDTDITEDDIVDDVTDQFGSAMHVAQLRVTAVWKRTTEIICVLEKVS